MLYIYYIYIFIIIYETLYSNLKPKMIQYETNCKMNVTIETQRTNNVISELRVVYNKILQIKIYISNIFFF